VQPAAAAAPRRCTTHRAAPRFAAASRTYAHITLTVLRTPVRTHCLAEGLEGLCCFARRITCLACLLLPSRCRSTPRAGRAFPRGAHARTCALCYCSVFFPLRCAALTEHRADGAWRMTNVVCVSWFCSYRVMDELQPWCVVAVESRSYVAPSVIVRRLGAAYALYRRICREHHAMEASICERWGGRGGFWASNRRRWSAAWQRGAPAAAAKQHNRGVFMATACSFQLTGAQHRNSSHQQSGLAAARLRQRSSASAASPGVAASASCAPRRHQPASRQWRLKQSSVGSSMAMAQRKISWRMASACK